MKRFFDIDKSMDTMPPEQGKFMKAFLAPDNASFDVTHQVLKFICERSECSTGYTNLAEETAEAANAPDASNTGDKDYTTPANRHPMLFVGIGGLLLVLIIALYHLGCKG